MSKNLSGTVETGMGRGANFIALPIYSSIFEKYLNEKPFHGTLNLALEGEAIGIVNNAFNQGDVHENLEYNGEKFGGVIVVPVKILGDAGEVDGVAVRPHLTSHDSDVIELVSSYHLREYYDLNDGDSLSFEILN